MNRDELEAKTRKELIALLPPERRKDFNPVSSKKADIIDALLAEAGAFRPLDADPRALEAYLALKSLPASTYGIMLHLERGLFVRWTPVGGGKWRMESSAVRQDEIVDGGPDVTHNGQWLVLDGLFDLPKPNPRAPVEFFWDGTPVPPVVVDDPKEYE